MLYLPGLAPDLDTRRKLLFAGGELDLRQFDKVLISVSGGKDSHAMLFKVRDLAERQGALDRLAVIYADTGMEWHNAEAHVKTLCAAAAVPLTIAYPARTMIDAIKYRLDKYRHILRTVGFPNSKCRYCTARQKVAPLDKETRRFEGKILKVTGERWGESKARANLPEFCEIERISSAKRTVFGWRPMLAYTTEDIFAMVKESGVPRHQCYDMGCSRLGCAGCIFSTDRDLKIEMRENPHIFEALDRLEAESGYTMSMSKIRIRDRIKK